MRRSIVMLIAVASVACSSSGSSSGGSSGDTDGGSSGGLADGGADASTSSDAGADAADAGPVNGCKVFDDRAAAGATRTITWGFPLAAADRCIDIKAGQSVTWSGNFAQYRVGASGGDTPNPIAGFDPDAPTVKFPTAGTFGFESPDAPALVGAIRVTP